MAHTETTQCTYENANRLKTALRSNNLLSSYNYDPASRLTQLRHTASNKILGNFVYTTDARGNRTSAYEAVPKSTTGVTTMAFNNPDVSYYQGVWTAASPLEVSIDTTAALPLAFFGNQATLTRGNRAEH